MPELERNDQLALTRSCRQFWQTLARYVDVDLDGRISQDEYVATFSSDIMSEQSSFDRMYRALLVNVVNLADADGDGKLNEEEYIRLLQNCYNADEADAAEAFRHLDRDGDGFLTLDELVRSATDFYPGQNQGR